LDSDHLLAGPLRDDVDLEGHATEHLDQPSRFRLTGMLKQSQHMISSWTAPLKEKLALIQQWLQIQNNINRVHFLVTLLVTIINIAWTISCVFLKPHDVRGMYLLFEGSCKKTSRLNTVLHFVINVLSTILLWATNHSMQLMLATSRTEVDHAHERGLYFDIGIASYRNFWRIPAARRRALAFLAVSATFLHLL